MPNTITNTANYLFNSGSSEYSKNATATVTKKVDPTTLITMTKSASPSTVKTGDTITYTVNINIGAVDPVLTNQRIVDNIPSGLTFVTGSLKVNGTATAGTPTNLSVSFNTSSNNTIEYKCTVN